LPLFHAGGLGIFFRSICAGSAVAIALPHSPLPPTCAVPVTHVSLVPTQLYRLLKGNERNSLQNLSAILVGGAPLPATLIEQALAQKLPLFTTYGLTEMASQVTCQQAQLAGEEATAPVGKVLPYRELTLSDSGEILVRGETLFTGYLVGETVVPPCDNAGWFHTGDLGRFTSDGDLVVVGRQDAQFISGGENIHPEMIEAAISSLPGVVAACVVPISDNEFGQRPYAFILTENGEINEHELLTALRQKIPFFALPKQISAAPSKMVTATGKLSKAVALSILRGKE
jgi:O-succinylbenzoic acid--CoA ligase